MRFGIGEPVQRTEDPLLLRGEGRYYEANPQQILDRREKVSLPPLLIMQGALDDNVLPSLQEKFAASWRAGGGECQIELFEGCEHLWVDKPGAQTDRAHEMVKAFIARNLAALRQAA